MVTLRTLVTNQLVPRLKDSLGDRLVSALAVGSAAAYLDAEDTPLLGDMNVVLVFDEVDLQVLDALGAAIRPRDFEVVEVLVLARDEVPNLGSVFPVEAREFSQEYVVLYGEDLFASIAPVSTNLVHQVAFEVASKRQALRGTLTRYGPTHEEVGRVLVGMARSFLPLAAALLGARGVSLRGRGPEGVFGWLQSRGGLTAAGAEAVRDLRATYQEIRRPAAAEKRVLLEALLAAWDTLGELADEALASSARGRRGRGPRGQRGPRRAGRRRRTRRTR